MFGIGLPEMIVILGVALIVVGPDKLPDLARSLARGVLELKKTVNQVKESLNEEGNVLGDVQGELKKTADDLQNHLLEGETTTMKAAGKNTENSSDEEDLIDLEPLEERPWEKDRKIEPESVPPKVTAEADPSVDQEQDEGSSQTDKQPPPSAA